MRINIHLRRGKERYTNTSDIKRKEKANCIQICFLPNSFAFQGTMFY